MEVTIHVELETFPDYLRRIMIISLLVGLVTRAGVIWSDAASTLWC